MRANLRPSNRGWRLDYFLLSDGALGDSNAGGSNLELLDSIIDDKQMGSDHCPIALKMRQGGSGKAAANGTKSAAE